MGFSKTGSFERIALYYEALANVPKRLEREGPMLLDVLRRAPGNRVLDLACGTGLHARWFAEQECEVTATDLSEAMIAYARRHRAHEHIDFRVSDMRIPPPGTWDLAVSMGNSLSLLITEDDLRQVFSNVKQRLSPKGTFLFQVLNYDRPEAQQPRHRVERAGLPDAKLVAIKNLVPDGRHTLLALNFFVEEQGGGYQSAVDTAVLRNWSRDVLLTIARDCGLETVALYGGFAGEAFDAAASPDLIVLLQKA